jgi:alpha-methylacyl-CoA racemase
VPPFVDGHSAFFSSLNAGDRSAGIDLRHPEGVAVVRALLAHYDVLVEGFKPGVMEAMGLDPAELVREFPQLIVARISGYGQSGPWRSRPGHDVNYLGLSGALADTVQAGDGRGVPGVQVADMAGALTAALGIAAALVGRAQGHGGRVLDISLAEAALAAYGPHVATLTADQRDARPGGELLSGALPTYGTYRCADGRWLTVGALEPKFQALLAETTGTVQREGLAQVFASADRDVWVERLAEACVGPVLAATEVQDHPQHAARGAVVVRGHTTFVRPPLGPQDWAPGPVAAVGEHTELVLREAGVAEDLVLAARQAGVFDG